MRVPACHTVASFETPSAGSQDLKSGTIMSSGGKMFDVAALGLATWPTACVSLLKHQFIDANDVFEGFDFVDHIRGYHTVH